jgi:hypothetical protein
MVHDATVKKWALITWQEGRATRGVTIRQDRSSDLKPLSRSNNLVAHDVVLLPAAADEFPSVPAFVRRLGLGRAVCVCLMWGRTRKLRSSGF